MTQQSTIDPDRYIGTVTQVNASQIQANLPNATARPESRGTAQGAVGDFIFVDSGVEKLLGRIIEVRIPDAERLTVEPKLGAVTTPHPIGRIEMLATVDQRTSKLSRGLKAHPRIGDGVYLASASLLAEMIGKSVNPDGGMALPIGTIEAIGESFEIEIPPEKLFGRHCGVFGATGGGKSWTIATLLQQIKAAKGKAIIFDPTGEFSVMAGIDTIFSFGVPLAGQSQVHFPYRHMTEDDLFSLFRPSGQSQGPKLRDAVKSLKLVQAMQAPYPQGLNCNGTIISKTNSPRAPYFSALNQHALQIHDQRCNFDITFLSDQLKYECIWSSNQNVPANFGGPDNGALGYCETLAARINTLVHSAELQCLFSTVGTSLVSEIAAFLADDTRDIASISFKDVRFEHSTREILLNIIGRYLLGLARSGTFRDKPIVVFLDEAHQFLGRTVGDEYGSVKLDSFGLIAKEGRKFGLTCVLATQRPRDIPQDILSQLGTLFVHRLTSDQDRETVERACGDLDRAAAQFIPMLSPGEAVLIGPDLPTPIPIKMSKPRTPPDSTGPQFQKFWSIRQANAAARGGQ